MKRIIFFSLIFTFFLSFRVSGQYEERTLHELNQLLINTVMDDLFSPPVASRIYVYPNIAFYECIRLRDENYKSLSGRLTDLHGLPVPDREAPVEYFTAAAVSF